VVLRVGDLGISGRDVQQQSFAEFRLSVKTGISAKGYLTGISAGKWIKNPRSVRVDSA
jgi:hypothetical protein